MSGKSSPAPDDDESITDDPTRGRCPACDDPLAGVVTTGPHTHHARPCGCRLSGREVRALLSRS